MTVLQLVTLMLMSSKLLCVAGDTQVHVIEILAETEDSQSTNVYGNQLTSQNKDNADQTEIRWSNRSSRCAYSDLWESDAIDGRHPNFQDFLFMRLHNSYKESSSFSLPCRDDEPCPPEEICNGWALAEETPERCNAVLAVCENELRPMWYSDSGTGTYNYCSDWKNKWFCAEKEKEGEMVSLCCDFRGQPLYLPSPVLRHPSVLMRRSRNTLIDLDPSTVRTVILERMFQASIFLSMETASDEKGRYWTNIDFFATNCSLYLVPAFRTASIVNTRVSLLEDMSNILNVFLKRSVVESIKNIKISREGNPHDGPSWIGFFAEFTSIGLLNSVEFVSLASINSSYVKRIENCSFRYLDMSSSYVSTITPNGATVTGGGYLNLTNVVIDHLHSGAIVIGRDASLILDNVTIIHCDYPCISVSELAHPIFTNVKINGEVCYDRSHKAFIKASTYRRQIHEDSTMLSCSNLSKELVCHLGSILGPVDVLLSNCPAILSIQLSNHQDVHIYQGCYENLLLWNIRGKYYSNPPIYDDSFHTPANSCIGTTQIQVEVSQLQTIYSAGVTRFISSKNSTVQRLNIGTVSHFNVEDLTIENLEHINYRPALSSDSFLYSRGTVKKTQNLELRSPATFKGVSFGKIEKIVISHPTSVPTRLQSCKVDSISPKGLYVESGSLELNNLHIKQPREGVIYLEYAGQLLLRNLRTPAHLGCAEGIAPISAVNESQVLLYSGGPGPDWLWQCVSFRNIHVGCGEEHVPQNPLPRSGARVLALNSDCHESDPMSVDCDLKNTQESVELIQRRLFHHYGTVVVYNGSHLLLGRHCFHKVDIFNVRIVEMRSAPLHCRTSLGITNSGVSVFNSNAYSVRIQDSAVGVLAQDSVVDTLELNQSRVHILELTVHHGVITDTEVNSVQNLFVTGTLLIRNCTLYEVKRDGIFVDKSASLIIENSTIGALEVSAIKVFGNFNVSDTFINATLSGAIEKNVDSSIALSRVVFGSDTSDVFTYIDPSPVTLSAVTIAGREALLRQQLLLLPLNGCGMTLNDKLRENVMREDICHFLNITEESLIDKRATREKMEKQELNQSYKKQTEDSIWWRIVMFIIFVVVVIFLLLMFLNYHKI